MAFEPFFLSIYSLPGFPYIKKEKDHAKQKTKKDCLETDNPFEKLKIFA